MSFRQHAVIEFLVKEEIPAAEIHQRLQHAYGSVSMGASSVRRWVKHFKDGNTSIEDEPRSGRPQTASTGHNKERVDEIIQDDRRVPMNTIARKLGIGHSAVQEMIESLCYRKVCAQWVPRLLTEDNEGQQKAHHLRTAAEISTRRLQCISIFGWLEQNFTRGKFSNSQNVGRNVYKEVAIMWKNKERYVD
ncbi:hypothetical protein B7P43_G15584 [Cryptotermes secundus]|uniref:Mos1 transposase HTH domain-containing protein n=1 Tax=Cryptotermes secundus TaxID=105785 RepID=A0A2J7RGN2_9NEOP|nr:hypothetical protein B7P43_G15584 [Cryptotermes secundus]